MVAERSESPMQEKKLPLWQSLAYFTFAILINSFGNGITVATNLGSALWTASAVNIAHLFNISLSTTLIIYGVVVVTANGLILGRLIPHKVIGNLLFMVPFGYLVQFFSQLLLQLGINALPLWVVIPLDFSGILLIAIGISIYQRVNLIMHPNDDLMQTIRFKFMHGNAATANWISFTPPFFISMLCFLVSGHLYALNIGSVFAILFQGSAIGLADKIIFPSLKHHNIEGLVSNKSGKSKAGTN